MRPQTTLFLCLFILKQLPSSTLQPIEATQSDDEDEQHQQLQEEPHQQLQEEQHPQNHEEEQLHEHEDDEHHRDAYEGKEESNNEGKPVSENIEEPEVNTESHNINFNKESFSFQTFRGPVKGVAREVTVPNSQSSRNGKIHAVDFVVKPDYSYSYGVHDKNSGNSHTHSESRDGDDVKGEYRVLQSDGLVRIVKYNAHPTTGFRVTVEYVKSDDSSS